MLHHQDTTNNKIVGRSFSGWKRIDEDTIEFSFADGGKMHLEVTGGCCSTSHFYDVVFPDDCINSEILKVAQEGSEENWEKSGYENPGEDEWADDYKWWDVVFITKAGKIHVKHVNRSNGYYDGYTDYRFYDAAGKLIESDFRPELG